MKTENTNQMFVRLLEWIVEPITEQTDNMMMHTRIDRLTNLAARVAVLASEEIESHKFRKFSVEELGFVCGVGSRTITRTRKSLGDILGKQPYSTKGVRSREKRPIVLFDDRIQNKKANDVLKAQGCYHATPQLIAAKRAQLQLLRSVRKVSQQPTTGE